MPQQRTTFNNVLLFDDFLLSADLTGWNDNTENSGTAAIVVNVEDGFLELTTGTTSGNRSQVTGERVFRSESGGPLVYECGARMITDLTEKGVFFGFTDVVTIENPIEVTAGADTLTTTATDAVGIIYDEEQSTTDRWFLVGVDTDVDAAGNGVVPATAAFTTPSAAATNDYFRIVVDIAGRAQFYINQALVYRTGTGWDNEMRFLTAAVSPDVNLCPTALVETRESGANTIYVDFLYVSKSRNP